MTDVFEAKVKGVPCNVHLDEEYHIIKAVTLDGNFEILLTDEDRIEIEGYYDFLIAEVRKENEQDEREQESHIKAMSRHGRYV